MSKPREFWISARMLMAQKPATEIPDIHVIEYSAYDELQAQAEKLASVVKEYVGWLVELDDETIHDHAERTLEAFEAWKKGRG